MTVYILGAGPTGLALVDEHGRYPGEECTLALCARERLAAPGTDVSRAILAAASTCVASPKTKTRLPVR